MSKICKKCDVLETNDNNDYCGICANELVADLEAKLAESELKYNATNRAYWELVEKQDNAFLQYEKLIGENNKLKQQLEEKEKEIESLATDLQEALTLIKEGRELVGLNNKVLEQPHQDKISFAVEQLNLLYKTLTTEDVWREMKKGWWLNNGECKQLRQLIDNQIEELKKEMK